MQILPLNRALRIRKLLSLTLRRRLRQREQSLDPLLEIGEIRMSSKSFAFSIMAVRRQGGQTDSKYPTIIDGNGDLLLGPEIAFGGLDI